MKLKIIGKNEKEENNKVPDFTAITGNMDNGIVGVTEGTELGETLKELNNDFRENSEHKMSGIDLRSRLHPAEISGLLAIDTLVNFKFIPDRCLQFTRQKKRLAVSIQGKGRNEIVDIAAGKRENDARKLSFGERISGKVQNVK